MKNYLLKRLLALIVTLFIIVSIAFLVIRLMPGTAYDDPSLSPQVLEAIDKKYHLDEPLIVQYGIFLKSILLDWDWGTSIKIQPTIPVFQVLQSKIPLTLAINLIALALSIPLGIIAGVAAAIKKNTLTDHAISFLVVIFISIPSFVFATVLQYFVAFQAGAFPITYQPSAVGIAKAASLFLPTLALMFDPIAKVARYMRAELAETLTSEYLLLASTKGLTRSQAIIRHGFRNSCLPLLNIIIPMFANILGGAWVIESIFAIPGMGKMMIDSINANDHYLTIAILLVYSLVSLLTILVVDILYAIIDPRVRMGGKK